MKALWDAPPPVVLWTTSITDVKPNSLSVRGIPLTALIEEQSLLEVAALLVEGALPSKATASALETVANDAARLAVPKCPRVASGHLSRRVATLLLSDEHVAAFEGSPVERTVFCLGRLVAYFAHLFDAHIPSEPTSFAALAYAAITGREPDGESEIGLIEAAAIASVDHGVTPPSAQATIIAASVRAQFEVALASGLAAITDVHGGAGASAAVFFRTCVDAASTEGTSLRIAAEKTLREYSAAGKRIEGLGHRLHQRDPRRDALWKKAHAAGVAGSCVATSILIEDAFASVRGLRIPINVDGVLGAIVADMQLHPRVATALFLFGRAAGLAAHYFEEVETQPPMRQIHFDRATYRPN
jgi:citrate synthase